MTGATNDTPCRLCGAATRRLFERTVLGRYAIDYHQCAACGLVQTDTPVWLDEAYASAIADIDTGLLARNLHARRVAAVFLHLAGARARPCLDWAGGNGAFTRLMRDAGFEFRWHDVYCANMLARGFEWDASLGTPFACTAFEVLEHLPDPRAGFAELAAFGAPYLITSTQLYSGDAPAADWFYLAPESGQHVAFYRRDTLERMGREFGYPYVRFTGGLQLFARQAPPAAAWPAALLPGAPLFPFVRRLRPSLTDEDSRTLRARLGARREPPTPTRERPGP